MPATDLDLYARFVAAELGVQPALGGATLRLQHWDREAQAAVWGQGVFLERRHLEELAELLAGALADLGGDCAAAGGQKRH